jgi:signal transduction histidine kinase
MPGEAGCEFLPQIAVTESVRCGMETGTAQNQRAFLSSLPAEPADRRLAIIIAVASLVFFAAAAPWASVQLAQLPAFLPAYQSALVICELITAALLFGQFRIVRSGALLSLGCGYLFSALMAVLHTLSFPGLFAPQGLMGAGSQTTAWIYFLWHAFFPLFVIGYALLKDRGAPIGGPARVPILLGAAGAVLLAGFVVLATTAGHDLLPTIMKGNSDAGTKVLVAAATWVLSVVALLATWRRRPHSVLDLWVMVVMLAWIFEVALASVLNAGRFDLGWYAGRAYGLLAASFVLVVLLLENSVLYARLAEAHGRHAMRLKLLHEIDRAVAAGESPRAIGGSVVRPLRDLLGVPRVIVNLFDLAAGEVEWLAAAGRRNTRIGGVRYSIQLMGDVEALKRGEFQLIDTQKLPPGPDVDALLASGVKTYMVMPMIAGGELIGALSYGGETSNYPEEQLAIAREVATQLAIAIIQARLYERVRGHADELELRVKDRTSELENVNKDLESFSYSVSHDLRSPLRTVDGYARMLEEDYGERLDDEGRRMLAVVRGGARRMEQLIDDLLEFSRLGRQPVRTVAMQLDELVNRVFEEQRGLREDGRIDLKSGQLGTVDADPILLKQVLANLIGNAIKYSSKREVSRIEVGSMPSPEGAVFFVKDNGAGFDMRYAGKLFNVFQRLHSRDEFDGTGVGLAIVQRVVERHGGRVWADAKVDDGATFYFTLKAA